MRIYKILAGILFVGLFSTFSYSQKSADEYFGEASGLLASSNFFSADSVFNIIVELDSVPDLYYCYALLYRSQCQYGQDNFSESYALIKFTEAEILRLGLSDNIYLQSDIYYFNGISLFELGKSYEALSYYQKTIDLYDKHSSFDFRIEDLYSNTAVCYLDIADYDNAIIYFTKSINSKRDYITDLDRAQWTGLKARAYQFKNKLTLAEEYFTQAFEFVQRSNVSNSIQELQLYDDWSSFLSLSRRFPESMQALDKVKSMNPKNANLINYYQNLGQHHLRSENIQEAIHSFENSMIETVKVYGEKHFEMSDGLLKTGDSFYELEKYETAIEFYTQAVNALLPADTELIDDSDIPEVSKILIHKLALEAQLKKAKIFSLMDRYEASKVMSNSAIEIFDYMLNSQLRILGSKLDLVNYIKSMYSELIDLAYDNDDNLYAFQLSQRGHGLLLDFHLKSEDAKTKLIQDTSLLAKDQFFKKNLRKVESDLNFVVQDSIDQDSVDYLEQRLFALRKDYDLFLNDLQEKYPAIFQQKSNIDTSITDLFNVLKQKNAALIEYYVTDSSLYSFVIHNGSIRTYRKDLPADFSRLVKRYRGLTTELSVDAYAQFVNVSYDLYQILLQLELDGLDQISDKLIIIPDGILNYISFDALLRSKPTNLENNRYDILNYTLKDYSLSYHYSSLLFLQKKDKVSGEMTAYAPLFSKSNSNHTILDSLVYNREEVLLINKVYNGEIYLDSTATKSQFIETVGDFSIAHLATHASCNDSLPMESKIYFFDAPISTHEIYNLPHKLDLVVLSACETGKGVLKAGEGIMSLSRAFIASGCKSVITSLWNVNDKTTKNLMESFYKNLSNNKSVQTSLHQSKLEYLSSINSIMDAHPYYWSGFVLVGDDVSFSDNGFIKNLALIFIVLILFVSLFYFLSRTSR